MMRSEFVEWWGRVRELERVRYFKPDEVLTMGASNGELRLNSFPPRCLWWCIVPTVVLADKVRHEFGRPLKVISAYRNKHYNKAIGGAAKSRHVSFQALDLAPLFGRPDDLHEIAVRLRDRRGFGGVGNYPWGVHIDSRSHISNW